MNILERYESAAQNYVRAAPVVFDRARGCELFDENGARYIDFTSGGGTLSYGHNRLKSCSALIDYLCKDGIVQTRDRASIAKREFVAAFVETVLGPRGLNYKSLFTDPASGSAAEVALRIARRDKQRQNVIAFTNGSHGLTEGALSVTSRHVTRYESLNLRGGTVFMPYCDYLGAGTDTIAYLRRYLEDATNGADHPAAAIVEMVQDDGGVQVASAEWLQALEALCREHGILLIADETRTGCGRTGPFFGFERAGLSPDIVLAPYAMAGGLPLSVVLMRPELDHWRPGEHAGIFQGDNLAFVCATELLSLWRDDSFQDAIARNTAILEQELAAICARYPDRGVQLRGAGMMWGIDFGQPASAAVVSAWALEHGLVVEPARAKDRVLLVQPPVTVDEDVLKEGLARLEQAVSMFLSHH